MTFLILGISYSIFAQKLVAEGKTYRSIGDFKVETAKQPMIINGVSLDTYNIKYANSVIKVTIAIEPNKDCLRYLILSDNLSVQYVSYETYFGVEKLDQKYAKDGFNTSLDLLDRSAYFKQRLISQGKNDRFTCIGLIGAFYPELIINKEALTIK